LYIDAMTSLEAVLRRDRAVVVAALAVMTAFAWCYIPADMDMGGMDLDGFRMIPAGIAIMAPASAPRSAMEKRWFSQCGRSRWSA
jgi:predicted metal-binding membrane protein